MARLRLPRRKRIYCPWGDHQVLALPILYGYPAGDVAEGIKSGAYRGRFVHLGCCLQPWRWYCPDCRFPIPSDDGHWQGLSEEQRSEYLRGLREAWEEEQRRRRQLSGP